MVVVVIASLCLHRCLKIVLNLNLKPKSEATRIMLNLIMSCLNLMHRV